MKIQIYFLALLTALVACTPDAKTGSPAGNRGSQLDGGIGVGNMTLAFVPETHTTMAFPHDWESDIDTVSLSLQNNSGSVIEAKKSEIKDLSSPSAVSLQQYMKAKYPSRIYKIVSVNGLEGVRADLISTADQKQSDIYLVSELKDFIHIQSDLKKASNGIGSGEQILSTIRVKYEGIPYPNAKTKTVTLPNYSGNGPDSSKAAYSLLGDCYSYVDPSCRGVSMIFSDPRGTGVTVGAAGYDHGRIIELGSVEDVPFDSVKVEGDYLIAPGTSYPLSDIYTAFTPKTLQPERDSMELKPGHVYLVRSVSWPEEDLITKFRVDAAVAGSAVTITYEKLVYVLPKVLKKQVDAVNDYTLKYEKPLSKGEVTLYNRSAWNNYFYASFNFEYSTSGNMFITHNGWDLLLDGQTSMSLTVPFTGGSIGQVVDVGTKDLDQISLADYPDPNTFSRDSADVKLGHTYIVYHYDYSSEKITYGAIQVLEVDPQNRFARLQFRRIAMRPVDYFQRWLPLEVPQGMQSVLLERGPVVEKSWFYPFINTRGDMGSHYYERMEFDVESSKGILYVDSRPYGKMRGFYRVGINIPLDSISQQKVESLRGKFSNRISLQKGAVYAVLLENFYDKTVMVIKVDNYIPGKAVELSMKYLYRGKTIYSDDEK